MTLTEKLKQACEFDGGRTLTRINEIAGGKGSEHGS